MKINKISNEKRSILIGVFILAAYSMLAGLLTQSKIVVMLTDVISLR
jgi:hypothetical protein